MTKRIFAAVLLLCLFVSVVYAQSAASVFGWPPADGSVTPAKLSGPIPVANGGTGKTTAAEALAALGGASLNGSSTVAFNASTINGVAPLTAAEKIDALKIDNTIPIEVEYVATSTGWVSSGYGGGISASVVAVSPSVNSAYASATRLVSVEGGAISYTSVLVPHRVARVLTYWVRVTGGTFFYSTSQVGHYDANGLLIRTTAIHSSHGEGGIVAGYNADSSGATEWSLNTTAIPYYPDAPYIRLILSQEQSSIVERTGFTLK